MAGEVGSAFVSILPSTRGFGGKLSSQLSGDFDKAGRDGGARLGEGVKKSFAPSIKGIAASMAGAFAAVKVGGFLKDAVGQASDLGESMSKANVVFGASSPLVRQFAKTAAKSLGQSQQQALEAAGTFGNLFTALKIGQRPAAKMSTQLVKLAGDLASFNNVDPAVALDALRSGLTGETEPLKKFGVNMNDATLKAEALKLGLIKSVKDGMTPAAKAQAAYTLILEQTKTAQGDFARTSGGLANQQRILSAQFTDLKAKVGGALLPAVTGLVKYLNSSFLPSLGKIKDALSPIGDIIGGVATKFTDFVSEVADGFKNFGAGASGTGLYDFGVRLGGAFDTAKTVAKDFFDGLKADAGPSGQAVFDFGQRVRKIVIHLFDGIKVNIKPLLTSITTQLRNIGQPIIDAMQVGLQTGDFSRLGAALSRALAATLNGAVAGVGAITKAVGNLLGKVDWVSVGVAMGKQAPALLVGLAAGILNFDLMGLLKGLANNWQAVLFAVIAVAFAPARLIGKVAEVLAKVPLVGPLLRWAFEGFAGLSKGLVGLVGRFFGFLGDAFVVGLHDAGITIGQGWGQALAQFPLKLVIYAGRVGGEVGAFLGKIAGFFLSKSFIVARAVGDVAGTVLKAFADMGKELFKAGADLIVWLAKGMLSKLSFVKDAAGKIAGGIKHFFPGSPVREGPLTSWNGGAVGERLVGFLAAGLSQTGPVEAAVARLASVVTLPTPTSSTAALAVAAGGTSIHYEVHNPLPEPASVSHAAMLRRLAFLHGAA